MQTERRYAVQFPTYLAGRLRPGIVPDGRASPATPPILPAVCAPDAPSCVYQSVDIVEMLENLLDKLVAEQKAIEKDETREYGNK